jgi:hypothetical protein
MTDRLTSRKAVILLIVVTAFSNCKKDNTATQPSLPAVVSFSGNIVPIFTTYCSISGCHTGTASAASMNLSASVAYAQLFHKHEIDTITPTNSMLYIRMNATASPMPPSGKLSSYDISLVLKWIQQKAKDN